MMSRVTNDVPFIWEKEKEKKKDTYIEYAITYINTDSYILYTYIRMYIYIYIYIYIIIYIFKNS